MAGAESAPLDWPAIVAYAGSVHARTYEVATLLDDAALTWRPRPGEFTAGELALHIAHSRLMNIELIRGLEPRYRGHALAPGTSAASVRERLLRASKKTIAWLSDSDPVLAVQTLSDGSLVPAWRIAIAGLIEHEVHHRSQLCEYLSALGVVPPPLYGLHAEALPRVTAP